MRNFKQAINGLETELRFIDQMNVMGFKATKVGEAYDIKHHFDLNIHANIEIKGMKALSRGSEIQDEYHWVELSGVADDGWLYNSHADLIAFETKQSWIMIKPSRLIDYIQRFVEHEYVTSPRDAIYKLYQRKNRNDSISLIPTEDLRKIGMEWSK